MRASQGEDRISPSQSPNHRRGRPLERPVDPTPLDGRYVSAEPRIGWLLRSWRSTLRSEATTSSFVAELQGIGLRIDPSRISRWENGRQAVPLDVITGYERCLELAPGRLTSMALALRRTPGITGEVRNLPGLTMSPDRVQAALDNALGDDAIGADWLELGMVTAADPAAITLPTLLWEQMTQRLVSQVGRCVGVAYLTRFGAATLLGHHPRALRAMLQGLGDYVTSDAPTVADALSLIEEMRDPQATDLVAKLLGQPPGRTLNAAIAVATAKAARGHFTEPDLLRIEGCVLALVRRDGTGSGGPLVRLGDLVAALPERSRHRVQAAVSQRVPAAGAESTALPTPYLSWPRRWARQVLSATLAGADDPMLERLVLESIFNDDFERRFIAAFTIRASPYWEQVAGGLGEVLDAILDSHPADSPLVDRLVQMLVLLGTEGQAPAIRRVIADPESPCRDTALAAAAHLPGRQGPDDVLALAAEPALGLATVYYAGMTAHPLLRELAEHPALPEQTRRLATGWLGWGSAIHER